MADGQLEMDGWYVKGARAVMAEGARIGLLTCVRCGVTLTLDPDTPMNVKQVHDDWHERNGE